MPEGVFRAGNFELRQFVLVGSSGVEVDLSNNRYKHNSF